MSFKNTMTDANKYLFEVRIYALWDAFLCSKSEVLIHFIIALIVEYLFSYTFINQNTDVVPNKAIGRINANKDTKAMLAIMKLVRDAIIHSPDQMGCVAMTSVRNSITLQAISGVLPFFAKKSKITNILYWIRTNYGVYPNIEKYLVKTGYTTEEFDRYERAKLLQLFEVYTDAELNDAITILL